MGVGPVKSNVRPLDLADLRSQVVAFEDRYGAPSERLYEVFTVNGVLQESADFREWSFVYGTLQDAAVAHSSA